MAIRLMINFARSGGTLLNQILGSLDNVIMLSEINPLGGGWGISGPQSYVTPHDQAKNWYNINLKSREYIESILELEEYCIQNGKYLIIRDWSFINFIPNIKNDNTPPKKLLNYELLKDKVEIIPFAFVRDPIDIWISLGMPDTSSFFPYYLAYVEEILNKNIEIWKYEMLCKDPINFQKKITTFLKIPNTSHINYWDFEKVNGDIQLKGEKTSRGRKGQIIHPLPRKKICSDKIIDVNNSLEMIASNKLLNYKTKYHSSLLDFFKFKI